MKRKFVQIAALCLSAALFLTLGEGWAAAAPSSPYSRIIRVGLHFGTGAMEGLNLQNRVGSGFRFGYYDSANQFVELGSTGQTAISVVETMNVYYGTYDGYQCYHTAISSNIAVGEYHLQLPGTYGTFAEAQAAASALEEALDRWAAVREELAELEDYYSGGQWMKDFEDDSEGKLPKNLKRGVLSEDAVYDLLTDWNRLRKRMRELGD